MSFDDIQTGCVIRYPYLWSQEARQGETAGRKDRPVAVGVRIKRANKDDLVVLLPITTKQPGADRFFSEIPETEKRRTGLNASLRLWLVLDDYNSDIIGQSFYLEPDPPLGAFSKAYFLPLMREFISRRNQTKGVDRNQL